MTTFYSDQYTSTGVSQTAIEQDYRAAAGTHRAKVRTILARATALATTADQVRFAKLHSGTRVLAIRFSGGDEAAAGAMNLGLYKAARHGGAVIDADLFASALAKNAARVDALIEATTLTNTGHRGKKLWEMADAGAGSYSADPMEEWEIVGTPSTSFTTTANSFLVEIDVLED